MENFENSQNEEKNNPYFSYQFITVTFIDYLPVNYQKYDLINLFIL